MFRLFCVGIVSVFLTTGCGGGGSGGSRSVSDDPTPIEALENSVNRKANYVRSIQEDAGSVDEDLTGTWIEFWGNIGTAVYEDGVTSNFNEQGFTVFSMIQIEDLLTRSECDGAPVNLSPKFENDTLIGFETPDMEDTSVTVKDNRLIQFENQNFNLLEAESDLGNGDIIKSVNTFVRVSTWVKVDSGVEMPAGTLLLNSSVDEKLITCAKAVTITENFDDGVTTTNYSLELTDTEEKEYSSTGFELDGEIDGATPYTISDNTYTAEFTSSDVPDEPGVNGVLTLQ